MQLFAFGSNGSGQLGIGHFDDVSVPTRCLFEVSTQSEINPDRDQIARIATGGNHTIILFKTGAVYASGSNENGRCGLPISENEAPQPCFRRIYVQFERRAITKFKAISATWEATFLVSIDDEVFVLGSGKKGETGLGEERTEAISGPEKLPNFPPQGARILTFSSGIGHTVVILSNGDVYGWGGSRKGQLGQEAMEKKIIWSPQKINGIPFQPANAACGREFTIITGCMESGESIILGSDRWNIISDAPRMLRGSVAASWHGVYLHEPNVYIEAWGRNDRGQLPPPDLPKPRQIAVGSEHVVALLENQTVAAFGWGEHGNCGSETDAQGNVKGVWNQIRIAPGDDSSVVGVAAGCATSWIIASR